MMEVAVDNWVLYDGECPFCAGYVRLTRLRDAVEHITLMDARQHPERVAEARARGLEVNQGMILKLDGRYFHGADCMNALALLSTSSGLFNRFNRALFRSPAFSRLIYPLLRAGRNATLMILGRKRL